MGLAEEILALDDRKIVEVEVPEWGGRKVRLREMSAADRDSYEVENLEAREQKRPAKQVRARLVALCLVDEDGKRVFSDAADIEKLGAKSAKALDRLFWKARELNILEEDQVKSAVKN